jgi:hypothetical protein
MTGRIIIDFPPGENNPRNSEGAFLTLKDGTIMFAYSRFRGNHWGDDMDADIVAVYSYDNGNSFHDMKTLFRKEELGAKNIMSVSLLRLDNSQIAIFYMVRMGFHDLRAVMRTSSDEGQTFSEAKYCLHYPGYFVTNNDRIVRLSNDRIFIPAAYHRCIGPDPIAWESFNGKGVARFFYSDDGGETFYESPDFGALNLTTRTGLQEPGVVEIEDGHLFCYARTDLGCQYISNSYDYGMTWEPFQPSDFSSPASPLSIKRVPNTKIFAAVYNPVPTPADRPQYGWGRTPLILRTSKDGCKTFGEPMVLENNPESGYCYTAIHFTDDEMLLAYCSGGPADKGCLNRLRIRSIPISEFCKY